MNVPVRYGNTNSYGPEGWEFKSLRARTLYRTAGQRRMKHASNDLTGIRQRGSIYQVRISRVRCSTKVRLWALTDPLLCFAHLRRRCSLG
jgi:hypothetical protein